MGNCLESMTVARFLEGIWPNRIDVIPLISFLEPSPVPYSFPFLKKNLGIRFCRFSAIRWFKGKTDFDFIPFHFSNFGPFTSLLSVFLGLLGKTISGSWQFDGLFAIALNQWQPFASWREFDQTKIDVIHLVPFSRAPSFFSPFFPILLGKYFGIRLRQLVPCYHKGKIREVIPFHLHQFWPSRNPSFNSFLSFLISKNIKISVGNRISKNRLKGKLPAFMVAKLPLM